MPKGTWQGGGTWQTSGGGGGLLPAVIIAAVLIGSGAASAAVSALEVIAIITGAVIGLAVLGGIAWLVYRARSAPARSDRPGRPITARPVYQLPPDPRPELEESHKPAAIGPGREVHYHFHVSAAELAAIVRNHTEEE
jgi:hypothetical protein